MKLLSTFFLAFLTFSIGIAQNRQMVVTIDDLPVISIFKTIKHQKIVTKKLLTTLKEREVQAIGFVNEGKLYDEGILNKKRVKLLNQWLKAGMDLGNHSYSHWDINRISLDDYQDDVLKGEIITRPLMKKYGKDLVYFRHPFLHVGNTPEKKDGLAAFLKEHHYLPAPVTIDNSEWIFARAYDNALKREDAELAKKVGESYVNYMEDKIAFYEKQCVKLFDREIKQSLLIHANTLNSDYLDELLNRIAKRGYEFISMEAALTDIAYQTKDEFVGNAGITWIDRWALTQGKKRDFFKGEPKTPEFIQEVAEIRE